MATVTDWLKNLTSGGGLKINSTPTPQSAGAVRLSPGQAGYQPGSPGGSGPVPYTQPQVIQDSGAYNYGGSGGSYGGGLSYDPQAQADQAQKDSLIGDLQSKWSTLQNVFNGLFGQVDNYAKDATGRLQQGYDTQQNDLINQYNKTQNQTASIYGARGIGDSSYLGDAQGQNNDTFNSSLSQMAVDREGQLAQLGQQVSGQKAQLQAQRDQYAPYIQNLSQYGVSDLQGLQGSLQGAIGSGQATGATLGTNSDFIGKLNAITPLEQQGTAQLAAKLKNLTLSSAPAQAKKYIAMGLIKANTLNDASAQTYWNDYFTQLLSGGA